MLQGLICLFNGAVCSGRAAYHRLNSSMANPMGQLQLNETLDWVTNGLICVAQEESGERRRVFSHAA